MARKPRIEFPGALYHVIARGNNRQPVFLDDSDRAHYEALLARYSRSLGFALYAYVLMPNHLHLLLESGNTPLSRVMQRLQQGHTQYFNQRHRRAGHVFQGRYKAILCDRDAYLLELVRYLHLNPVRAGLVERPAAYRWSSHACYLGRRTIPWLETDVVLSQLGKDRRTAVRRYVGFMADRTAAEHRPEFYQVLDQRILGDERFAEASLRRGRREPSLAPRKPPPLERLLHTVALACAISPDAIRSSARRRAFVRARCLFIFTAHRIAGHPATAVARFLGMDPSTVSVVLRRLEARQDRVAELEPQAHQIARRASGGPRGQGE